MVMTRVNTRKRDAERSESIRVQVAQNMAQYNAERERKNKERATWLGAAGPSALCKKAKEVTPPHSLPFLLGDGERDSCTVKYRAFSICPMVRIEAVRGGKDCPRPWENAPRSLRTKENATLVFGIKMHRAIKSPFDAPKFSEAYMCRLAQRAQSSQRFSELAWFDMVCDTYGVGTVRAVNRILDAMPTLHLPEAVYHLIKAFLGRQDDSRADVIDADGKLVYFL